MTVLAFDGVAPAQAGWLGLVVIVALAASMVFLYRSMSKQLGKVPASFDESTAPPAPPAPDDDPAT
jgi:hypothetical protein